MTAAVTRPDTDVPAQERGRLFELAALLLTYPDPELLAARGELSTAAGALEHRQVADAVQRFLIWFDQTPATAIGQHYVQTFDLRRKSGLYLTYYLHGDTRKRGIALLTLKQRYRAHGLTLREGELPDLLPVVLEFAATVGPGDGEAPLRQHRQGIELLRAALEAVGSPYVHLLDAVCLALPPITDADRAAIAALAVDGPPVESVGLTGPGGLTPPSPDDDDELAAIGLAPYGAAPTPFLTP
ncbi:nitrate reductase molybdenum cofactor assembly chaperone, partial [Blastococcus atacamensis]|uniref:nitrate reductase molybdenum cofactor assembly chaperone n=1 Tax=Blastococcus atacamensis TaxID=2070508 RepID=UPI000CEBA356